MLGNCGMKKGVVLGTSDSSNANTYRFSLEALIASLALKDKQANHTCTSTHRKPTQTRRFRSVSGMISHDILLCNCTFIPGGPSGPVNPLGPGGPGGPGS